MASPTSAQKFLSNLNEQYHVLHKAYEDHFWISYMGDHTHDAEKDKTLAERDAFRTNTELLKQTKALMKGAQSQIRERLAQWVRFFEQYQSPAEAIELKKKTDTLESHIQKKRSTHKEGYIDPKTQKFVEASSLKMSMLMRTHSDEKIRKACFDAIEKLATLVLAEYIELVKLRNQYARLLGYIDFYDFKVQREDGMTKKELFSLFDSINEKTKSALKNIRDLEKTMPGLRKPWNFSYLMSGDFTKEDDPYFQFDEALMRWGRSFSALGIDFKGSRLQLDLLDRKGKWNNGFCHWPDLVHFKKENKEGKNAQRISGSSNFTCNVIPGQIGSGIEGYNTLFHEGGHSAHFLTAEQKDVILNQEYAPMSMAWAETQSMFLDTMFSSIEWKTRYAKNVEGKPYPFELYQRKLKKLYPLRVFRLRSIIFIANFEKEIYEAQNLTPEKACSIARNNYRKYSDRSEDSLSALDTPHIYSWESSASYHGYGLAELAVQQWRDYFYTKYGYIVDNPKVGKEMAKVWKLGAKHSFKEFVKLATGKKLSSQAFIKNITMPYDHVLTTAHERIKRLNKVREYSGPVKLNAHIRMVHGKEEIATSDKSFEDMAEKYKVWMGKVI